MQADVGTYTLIAALAVSIYAFFTAILGARAKRSDLVESSERAVVGSFFLIVFASGILLHALAVSNFGIEYVAHYTSTTLPIQYKMAAFWGGQAGSMLFWVLVLSIYTIIVLLQNQNRNRALMPYVTAVLMSITIFFLATILFAANPFKKLIPAAIEGQSLNPLLQNYWMVSHPPTLYSGYVGLSIPFAFAMAALITGRLEITWIKAIRRWTLASWLFLTLGIIQGSYWAYIELGWGGYWAWDPVENASLMPWLAATAFLHSVMVQEKKGMLKIWNMVLVLIAFTLSIFGTFLTRSGVVSSVHSFAQSPIGTYFIGFIAVQSAASIYFLLKRKKELAPENRLESFVSRESSFLFNNIFFLVICLAVLCGTTFPILSEWVTGSKVTVSAPFFNKVITPFAIGLILLTGICPLIAWRKASIKNLQKNFLWPAVFGLAAVIAFIFAGTRHWLTLIFVFSSFFVLATVYLEFSRGTIARIGMVGESIPTALYNLIIRNKRRYGGYIIHCGVALMFIGIALSSFYQLEKEAVVKKNESFVIGHYELTLRSFDGYRDPHKEVVRARLEILKNNKRAGYLLPERHFYANSEQPTTEVAIRPFWNADLYLILAGWDNNGSVTFKVFVNPFIGLLWWGAGIMGIGGLIVLLPAFSPKKAAVRVSAESGAGEPA